MTYAELFAGVSGMGLGFDRAGMLCRWRVEWDKAAAGVLAHHSPQTPLFSDVVAFAAWLRRQRIKLSTTDYADVIQRLGTDTIGGGSPCQDLSVAGLRKGLDGARSGLFRVMVRICRILRPRYVVWENVLGALSSNEGRDFAAVIGAFTGCIPEVPDDGWGQGGFARAAEPGRWNVAWRCFDSQYFGVPQRRRRVFLVASLGDGSCSEILFEPESVRGDNPPSRRTGERPSGTLSARTGGGGGLGTDHELDGGLIAADVAPTLNAAFGSKQGLENQHINGGGCSLPSTANLLTSRMHKGANTTCDEGQTLIPTRQGGFPSSDHVAHTLRGEGFDASEDGTGRKAPLIAGVFNWQAGGNQTSLGANTDTEATLATSTTQAVAFQTRVARNGRGAPSDVVPALSAQAGGTGKGDSAPCIAISGRARGDDGRGYGRPEHMSEEVAGALDTVKPDRVLNSAGVRRLTPRECERLQGWPDDHTRYGRKVVLQNNRWQIASETIHEQADGPRYKQCGNGITATVSEWIGKRIKEFTT